STQIGKNLDETITHSENQNVIFCVENTVSVDSDENYISVYDQEPCNLFIELEGLLSELKSYLEELSDWKPIAIEPFNVAFQVDSAESRSLSPGHSATVSNENNILYQTLLKAEDTPYIIKGGNFTETSIIENKIFLKNSSSDVKHRLVLNIRKIGDIEDIKNQLRGVRYKEFHSFKFGAGSNRREHALTQDIIDQLNALEVKDFSLRVSSNPGRSDASAIWNELGNDLKDRVAILTMGPGTRSHFDGDVKRATHGNDEGFHKLGGCQAINFLIHSFNKILD
ncbi:MAG: hypothetical protein AAF244_02065, partial [Pseudomonadota bacterium]